MRAPLLVGKNVKLRAIEDCDKDILINPNRDPEFLRMVGEDKSSHSTPSNAEFENLKTSALHWAIELKGTCIGIAFLHSINDSDKRAKYAVGIFHPEHWGYGYGEESTRLILKHAFEKLSLHRIEIRVLSYNDRAIRCYEKCGFVVEGMQRESALVNGSWHNDLLMGVLSSEYAI